MAFVRGQSFIGAAGAFLILSATLTWAQDADAIPAFSRRYETSCTTCHQFHYPRLNSFGRQFRENGYQWPAGAEETARSKRMLEPGTPLEVLSLFKEFPISMRGQVFGVVRPTAGFEEELSNLQGPALNLVGQSDGKFNSDVSIYSFIMGGGTVAKDVSYYFTWTPFPNPSVHQARIGLHNIFSSVLGEGTLNLRAGALFLLDFQRPSHRFLSALTTPATSVGVGLNRFTWDEATVGVEIYGRPFWGPFHYEIAIVTGDPGEEGLYERDNWKDIFARGSYIFFQNTSYETRLGLFGYLGNSLIQSDQGGLELQQNDTFGMFGGDIEVDVGPVNIFAMGYGGYHTDPYAGGGPGSYLATREQIMWAINDQWFVGARHEFVGSMVDADLNRNEIGPHVTYALATNVLVSAVWRQSLAKLNQTSGVVTFDVTY